MGFAGIRTCQGGVERGIVMGSRGRGCSRDRLSGASGASRPDAHRFLRVSRGQLRRLCEPARAQPRSVPAAGRPASAGMAPKAAKRGESDFSESAAPTWVSETRSELQRRSGPAASASSSAGPARWSEAASYHAQHDPAPPAPSSSSSSAALGPASITRPPLEEQGSFEDECARWRHVLFDLATSPANFLPARNTVYICGRPVQVRLSFVFRGV